MALSQPVRGWHHATLLRKRAPERAPDNAGQAQTVRLDCGPQCGNRLIALIKTRCKTRQNVESYMNRISKMLPALIACALCAAPAFAQDGTLKKIKDNGFITVGHRDSSIPFSYYDDKQQPIGYAMDLCAKIVDAVKSELKAPKLDVKYQLVTSANRIPLMANGTIDLECGSTTNNLDRQKQVA